MRCKRCGVDKKNAKDFKCFERLDFKGDIIPVNKPHDYGRKKGRAK